MKSLLALLFLVWMPGLAWAQGGNILLEEGQIFRPTTGRHAMVSSAEPISTRIGVEVLRRGGNAVDAAVTMAFVEAVTLPRAGNLGGGGFLLLRTAQGRIRALDFRETAPRRAARDMYRKPSGEADPELSTRGHLSAGVPGTVAGLARVLEEHGTLSLRDAIEPARRLAEEGFPVPPTLAADLAGLAGRLRRHPASAEIFLPGGHLPDPGDLLVQKDLAWSLSRLQDEGVQAFYRGEIARRLVRDMSRNGGLIDLQDLAGYQAVWREPLVGTYRGYEVWSMPPPSSGGVHLVQILNMLEGDDLAALGQNSAATLHLLAESMRAAYADRSEWLGDPDFVQVPLAHLLDKGYARDLRRKIPPGQARRSQDVRPGSFPGWESEDTTHLSVVDAEGGAVSLTYTLNFSYGSGVVAAGTGILLNNQMDDFAAAPGHPNAFGLVQGRRNAIAPRKRPLSSMTPTLVTRDGEFVMALGSPGGPRIISTVLQVLLNVLDFGLNAQEAVSRPRIHHQWLPDELRFEQGLSPDTLGLLERMGHLLAPGTATGQCALVRRRPDGILEGGIDLRRPGSAEGY